MTQARDERGDMAGESNLRRGEVRGEVGAKVGTVCEDPEILWVAGLIQLGDRSYVVG